MGLGSMLARLFKTGRGFCLRWWGFDSCTHCMYTQEYAFIAWNEVYFLMGCGLLSCINVLTFMSYQHF